MWNGDNGADSNAENNAVVITPEQALEIAVNARDEYKRQAEMSERRLSGLSTKVLAAKDFVEEIFTSEDCSGSYVSVDVDKLKDLAKALGMELTKSVDVEFDIHVNVSVTIPIWEDEDDVHMTSIDDLFDIDVEVSEGSNPPFDLEVYGSADWEVK